MADQQFVLKWHYHGPTLLQNIPSLLENDILSDVTLSVGAQHVKAHKIILAMCSVYFLQLFQELKHTHHPVVVLHNASIEDVRAMLAFMYRGQCVVSENQLPNLLSVAKLLKIHGLCDMKVPEKPQKPTEAIPLNETTNYSPYEDGVSLTNAIYNNSAINLSMDQTDLRREKPKRSPPTSTDIDDRYVSPKQRDSETCKCFLCGKYLSNQYNLRVHMETHEEAYHACQSCPHVSRSRDALRKHISYRHPERYATKKRKKYDNS